MENLLRNQLFQQLDGKVLLLHVGDFFKEFRVKEGELRAHIRKQVDDAFALDAVLQ